MCYWYCLQLLFTNLFTPYATNLFFTPFVNNFCTNFYSYLLFTALVQTSVTDNVLFVHTFFHNFANNFCRKIFIHIFSCQCQHHLYVNQYFVFNIRINNSISCLCQPEVYVNLYKMPIIRIRIYFYVNKKFILRSQYKNH